MKTTPYAVHCLIQKQHAGIPFDISDMNCCATRSTWREFNWTDMQWLEFEQNANITLKEEKDILDWKDYEYGETYR